MKHKFGQWSFESHYIKTVKTAKEIVSQLVSNRGKLYGLDIETAKLSDWKENPQAGLDPYLSRIRLLQIYDGVKNVYVFDLFVIPIKVLAPLLQTGSFVAHNAMFEILHITHAGYPNVNIGCSMILSQIIQDAEVSPYDPPEDEEEDNTTGLAKYRRVSHSLDGLVQRLFGVRVAKEEQISDWSKKELSESQISYAALDALLTYVCAKELVKKLKEHDMVRYYHHLKSMQQVIADIQLRGIPVDWDYHKTLVSQWQTTAEAAEKACAPYFKDINMRSSKQMNEWLKTYLKDDPITLASWPRTKTGYGFGKTVITAYRHLPAISALLNFKITAKLLDTYGDSLATKAHPITRRLHTSYTLAQTRTGRMSSRDPNCYSKDTEILTQEGWKLFPDLEKTDLVASWHESGEITFVKPKQYFKYKFKGELIHLKNSHTDLLVTPDHRCLTINRKTSRIEVISAQSFKWDKIQIHAGKYVTGKKSVNKTLLRLLIATQADGSITPYNKLDFKFSKKRKVIRLLNTIKKLSIKYKKSISSTGQIRITVYRSKKVQWIINQLGPQKKLPNWILRLNKECLDTVTKEFRFWDGLTTRKSDAYCSVVRHNVDIVQACFTLSNRRAIITPYTVHQKYGKDRKVAFNVLSPHTNKSYTTNIKPKKVRYNDYVYCVEVPSSFIVVRRNGRAIVSGNCQNFPRDKEFRNLFRADDGHVIVVSDFSQIELRLQAEFSRDPRMCDVYREGRDIYCEMASVLFNRPITKDDKKERFVGKNVMLALGYGMGPTKLQMYATNANAGDHPLKFWEEAHAAYHRTFSTYSKWCDRMRFRAKKLGYIETLLGKRRKLSEDEVYTRAPNTVIQGTAAELMGLAMKLCNERIKGMVATVHDEILLHVPEKDGDRAKTVLASAMNDAMKQMFPKAVSHHVADAAFGVRWGDAKGEI